MNCLQRSVTCRPNKWRKDQWTATLKSLDPENQSLWRMTKRLMRIPIRLSLVTRGESLSLTLRKPKPYPTVSKLSFIR
jgi:hypothetical protein